MIKEKAKESFSGLMEEYMMENGKTVSNMGKESSGKEKMERRFTESGTMGRKSEKKIDCII